MRVGFLIDRWEPRRGGAERALALLAAHLEGRGHDVRVFAERADPMAPGRFGPVAVSFPRGLLRFTRERALAHQLVGAARGAACDVTVGIRHLPEVDLYWPHDGAHRASLAARARARGRTVQPTGRHRVFLDFERRLLAEGGARRIVCVSELVRDELARLYPACAERLVVVPNGIDLELFHPRNRPTAGAGLRERIEVPVETPLLVFAGRDPVRKGLAALLAALERLRGRSWCLLVAGVRHPARWRRIAARHGLRAPRVQVEEFLPAPELLAAADLLVMPTWRDACLLAVLEALASGTPVVTTRHAGAATVVEPAVGTVLDEPDDGPALAGAVDAWLDRIERGDVDRAAIRAAVSGRGERAWLARLEDEIDALYKERRSGGGSASSGSVALR